MIEQAYPFAVAVLKSAPGAAFLAGGLVRLALGAEPGHARAVTSGHVSEEAGPADGLPGDGIRGVALADADGSFEADCLVLRGSVIFVVTRAATGRDIAEADPAALLWRECPTDAGPGPRFANPLLDSRRAAQALDALRAEADADGVPVLPVAVLARDCSFHCDPPKGTINEDELEAAMARVTAAGAGPEAAARLMAAASARTTPLAREASSRRSRQGKGQGLISVALGILLLWSAWTLVP